MVSVQTLVTGVAVVDLVLAVALLAGDPHVAGYTLAATLGRAPLFLGLALSIAVFPALSRDPGNGRLAAASLRTLLLMCLPVLVVGATAPAAVLHAVLPADFAEASRYLPYTVCGGTAFAVATLLVGWLKAVGAFASCLRLLGAGTLIAVAFVTLGALIGDVTGLAIGAVAGSVTLVVLLAGACVRRWPGADWSLPRTVAPSLVALALLVATRGQTELWLAAAVVVAADATWRLLRPRTSA